MEANQKVPLFLANLKSENEKYLDPLWLIYFRQKPLM